LYYSLFTLFCAIWQANITRPIVIGGYGTGTLVRFIYDVQHSWSCLCTLVTETTGAGSQALRSMSHAYFSCVVTPV